MKSGSIGTYTVDLPIENSLPSGVVELTMYLVNEDEDIVTCAKGDVELV